MADTSLIGTIVVSAGAIIAAILTHRSSRDSNYVTGFNNLNASLQAELKRLTARVEQLEKSEAQRKRLAHAHMEWDMAVLARLSALTAEPFPAPPPLDLWD